MLSPKPVRSEERQVVSNLGLVEIFDTTLRDGSQLEGISLTVEDKFRIAEQLDLLGVHFIEAGWPGASPKDSEFFERAKTELHLMNSTLVAFGSTRRAEVNVHEDTVSNAVLNADTSAVCLFGKTWDYHVLEALRTTLDEGLAMIADSVSFFVDHGRSVHFDAEHFFDGYKNNKDFTLRALDAAANAGAQYLVLCDTNGGTLPDEVFDIVSDITTRYVSSAASPTVSIHAHDDGACGVANALAAVRAGAREVQGTINGYGERTGNCNLVPVIANLSLKMGYETVERENLSLLSPIASTIAELVNMPLNPQAAYVGSKAFTHKAGVHTSALSRRSDAYEHLEPATVGNKTRYAVSEMAGRTAVEIKAHELGIELDSLAIAEITEKLKSLEYGGYHFEVADASLELLMRQAAGWKQDWFDVDHFDIVVHESAGDVGRFEKSVTLSTTATIALKAKGISYTETAQGNGPVNALDNALRQAIEPLYPQLKNVKLLDYKVRILDSDSATGAITRVLIDMTNGSEVWTTIGVSDNIIEASWQALTDGIIIGLLRDDQKSDIHSDN